MLGTLNGALEVRQVSLPNDAIAATVEGINEVIERIPTLTEIKIHYTLRVTSAAREVVDRALASHQSKCPSAHSLIGAVAVTWTADITEE
jgi:organic hydroperoxide reductase OsmC/OhrA